MASTVAVRRRTRARVSLANARPERSTTEWTKRTWLRRSPTEAARAASVSYGTAWPGLARGLQFLLETARVGDRLLFGPVPSSGRVVAGHA